MEPSSQGSPEGLLPPEPVQTSSPSLLCSYSSASLAETSTASAASAAEAACDAPCPARGPQVLGGYQATLPSLSPVFPILSSRRLQSLPEVMPHREQADSSGTAFPPDPLKHSPSRAGTQGGDAVGTKRKLPAGGDQALGGQQHPPGAAWDRGRDTGRRLEPVSAPGTKKSRKEEMGLQRGEELEEEEEEQATSASGPSSRPGQHRALQPVKMKQLFPLGGWSPWRFCVSSPLLASIPKAFPHLAGGDGWLKVGLDIDGGSSPPKGGSGALGEDVVEPMLGGSQHLLEHLPALQVK